MSDAEVVAQQVLGGEHRIGRAGDDVSGGDVHAGCQLPDMQIVHLQHSGDVFEGDLDLSRFDARGSALREHAQYLKTEHHGSHRDECGDTQRDDGIPPGAAGDRNKHGGRDDTDRTKGVSEHLQVGALNVQALGRSPAQQQHADNVDDKSEDADGQHDSGGRLDSAAEAADRFDRDEDRHPEHDEHGKAGREDLNPVVAEGAASALVTQRRQMQRQKCGAQCRHVGGHVARIAEQCQRA
ncbi:hypothetical protein SDC9_157363 [bioreactor metagenome]|uniref:Uncharacterized protein n=1 Tax=bioreactor metagenome TaxID=1076179 RepID=A0A645F844_9ZZZZ